MQDYCVQMEISGPYAMWTRPDTGDCPVSYPAPTASAVRGIFESILWGPAVRIMPIRAEICRRVQYHSYYTNYSGPLRKSKDIAEGNPYQLLTTILVDVCYRLYAQAIPAKSLDLPESARRWDKATTSPGHAYQAMFNRRLTRGQSFCIPCLGWKEFVPDYVGPFREETQLVRDIDLELPSMLLEVFPHGYASRLDFTYVQDVRIEGGILTYSQGGEPC